MPKHRLPIVLAVAGGVAFFSFVGARLVVFERVRIPQGGMFPTYPAGSHVFMNEWRPDPALADSTPPPPNAP